LISTGSATRATRRWAASAAASAPICSAPSASSSSILDTACSLAIGLATLIGSTMSFVPPVSVST
jgi:hypothetical protein